MSQFLQQLLNKAKEKADALEQEGPRNSKEKQPPVDTATVSDTVGGSAPAIASPLASVSDIATVSDISDGSDLSGVSDTLPVSDPPERHSSHALFSEYAALQSKIHDCLPHVSPSELRLYLYLVDLAFVRLNGSDGIIEYNQREVMRSVGFGSHSTAVKVISSLAEKHLVTWLRKSNKRGERSLLRVALPPGLPVK